MSAASPVPPAGARGLVRRVERWRRSPAATTAIRYVAASCIAVAVGQLTLVLAYGVVGWTARSANYLAFVLAGIPSYTLNRRWAWGRKGRSHLLQEVVPFWVIALIGLGMSTWAVSVADRAGRAATDSRTVRTALLMVASLVAFGLVWIGKFVVLNRVLFAQRGGGAEGQDSLGTP